MASWSTNKKVKYKAGEPTVTHGVTWMTNLVEELRSNKFRHYRLTSTNSKKRGRPVGSKNRTAAEIKEAKEQKTTVNWNIYNVQSRYIERKMLEIIDVPCFIEFDWVSYAKSAITSVLKRGWKLGKDIDRTQLDDYEEQRDFYFD